MNKVKIQKINPENARDLNSVDGTFIVDAILDLYLKDGQINYKIVKTPPTETAIEPI